jgi:hypothetical protein
MGVGMGEGGVSGGILCNISRGRIFFRCSEGRCFGWKVRKLWDVSIEDLGGQFKVVKSSLVAYYWKQLGNRVAMVFITHFAKTPLLGLHVSPWLCQGMVAEPGGGGGFQNHGGR